MRTLFAYFFCSIGLAAGAQAACPGFLQPAPATPLGPSAQPAAIAVADFNGDGKLDFAVADESGNMIVALGHGDGTFGTPATYAAGSNPQGIVAADFNGDGKPDLAVANSYDDNLSIFIGNGDGTFKAAVNYSTVGSGPTSIAAADVNGDGRIDLAVADGFSNKISILLGNGNGTFGAATTLTGHGDPTSLITGDFNQDGKIDLAVTDYYGGVGILLGNGNGTFGTLVSYTAGTQPMSVATGDFNGDGVPDLAVANYTSSNANVSILIGTGAGHFAAPVNFAVPPSPIFILAADLNADGKTDLVVATQPSGSGVVIAFLGSGTGTFTASTTEGVDSVGSDVYPQSLASGDFNGDGKIDVVAANLNGQDVTFFAGTGTGNLLGAPNYSVSDAGNGTVIADFNNDGKLDFAVAETTNLVTVHRSLGNGVFGAGVILHTGAYPGAITAADFNGDGNLDIAVANRDSDTVSIFLGNGNGNFATAVTYTAGHSANSIAAADFNGDGKMDLVIGNGGSSSFTILLNSGTGTFGAATDIATPDGTALNVTVADFNGDGKSDVVVGYDNLSSHYVSVFMGNGNGTFATAVNYETGDATQKIAASDLNGDGKPDLVVLIGQTVEVLMNTGNGTFAAETTYQASTDGVSLAIDDFDGDGHKDLAIGQSGGVVLMLGNGNGTFGSPIAFGSLYNGDVAYALSAGDLDGDGKPDLLLGTSVTWTWFNRSLCATIASLAPNTGPTSGGQSVTISGTNLGGATSVTFGGVAATITSNTATSIVVTTPAHASGAVGVIASTATGNAILAAGYTYGVAVTATPANVSALATSNTHVNISWSSVSGASYQIDRMSGGGGFVQIGSSGTNSFSDLNAVANTSYLYRVRAVASGAVSANSNRDLATTVIFTDAPLTAGIVIKRIHLTDLRTAVNAVRALAGLTASTFTDSTPTVISAVHISELRAALDSALSALGFTTSNYTDGTLTHIVVKAVHFQEIRDRTQ